MFWYYIRSKHQYICLFVAAGNIFRWSKILTSINTEHITKDTAVISSFYLQMHFTNWYAQLMNRVCARARAHVWQPAVDSCCTRYLDHFQILAVPEHNRARYVAWCENVTARLPFIRGNLLPSSSRGSRGAVTQCRFFEPSWCRTRASSLLGARSGWRRGIGARLRSWVTSSFYNRVFINYIITRNIRRRPNETVPFFNGFLRCNFCYKTKVTTIARYWNVKRDTNVLIIITSYQSLCISRFKFLERLTSVSFVKLNLFWIFWAAIVDVCE